MRPLSVPEPVACVIRLEDHDSILSVFFLDQHLNDVVARSRHHAADIIGPDRKLPVPAIDDDRELDARRTAKIDELIEGAAAE